MVYVREATTRTIFGDHMRDIVRGETELDQLAIECARFVAHATYLSLAQKRAALQVGRRWADYVNDHGVTDEDPFQIRKHVAMFASETFPGHNAEVTLCETDIDSIEQDGQSYSELLSEMIPPEVLDDPEVAIYGGAARLALKMYAGVSLSSELPLHDIDAIISSETDASSKAELYHVDLSGAKVIDDNLEEAIRHILVNVDCTMNQVAIYQGKLIYTDQALADIRDGVIRPVVKSDPLFGVEGEFMPNGEPYAQKKALYRVLSFFCRGKGERIALSQENMDQEKDSIGRHWLVILLVKILPMRNTDARYQAIGQWHEIAHRIGATESGDPVEFFDELLAAFPEARGGNTFGSAFDSEAQLRWIIEKLTDRTADYACGREIPKLPETYTPILIERTTHIEEYDIEALLQKAHATFPALDM